VDIQRVSILDVRSRRRRRPEHESGLTSSQLDTAYRDEITVVALRDHGVITGNDTGVGEGDVAHAIAGDGLVSGTQLGQPTTHPDAPSEHIAHWTHVQTLHDTAGLQRVSLPGEATHRVEHEVLQQKRTRMYLQNGQSTQIDEEKTVVHVTKYIRQDTMLGVYESSGGQVQNSDDAPADVVDRCRNPSNPPEASGALFWEQPHGVALARIPAEVAFKEDFEEVQRFQSTALAIKEAGHADLPNDPYATAYNRKLRNEGDYISNIQRTHSQGSEGSIAPDFVTPKLSPASSGTETTLSSTVRETVPKPAFPLNALLEFGTQLITEGQLKMQLDPENIPVIPPHELWYARRNFTGASNAALGTEPSARSSPPPPREVTFLVSPENLVTHLIPGFRSLLREWEESNLHSQIQRPAALSRSRSVEATYPHDPSLDRSVTTDGVFGLPHVGTATSVASGDEWKATASNASSVLSPRSERELINSFASIASIESGRDRTPSQKPAKAKALESPFVPANPISDTQTRSEALRVLSNLRTEHQSVVYTASAYFRSIRNFISTSTACLSELEIINSDLENFIDEDKSNPAVPSGHGARQWEPRDLAEMQTQLSLLRAKEKRQHVYCANPRHYSERRIIVDWMCEFGEAYKLSETTLHLAIKYADLVLGHSTDEHGNPINTAYPQDQLQGIVTACILVATKFEELEALAPSVKNLRRSSGSVLSCKDIVDSERFVLRKLDWQLSRVLAVNYLSYYRELGVVFESDIVNGNQPTPRIVRFTGRYLTFFSEILLQVYEVNAFIPSIQAAAIVACARRAVKTDPIWNQRLTDITGYTERDIYPCYKLLFDYYLASFPDVPIGASEESIAAFERAAGVQQSPHESDPTPQMHG